MFSLQNCLNWWWCYLLIIKLFQIKTKHVEAENNLNDLIFSYTKPVNDL